MNLLSRIQSVSLRASAALVGVAGLATKAHAQPLGAQTSGIFGSIPDFGGVTDIRGGVTSVIESILNFMALIAVVIIVIAGIRLVISQGDEGAVDTAKKTILYALIGLIIILLAGAIVDFVAQVAGNATTT